LSILAMAFSGRLTNTVVSDVYNPLFAPFARFWPDSTLPAGSETPPPS